MPVKSVSAELSENQPTYFQTIREEAIKTSSASPPNRSSSESSKNADSGSTVPAKTDSTSFPSTRSDNKASSMAVKMFITSSSTKQLPDIKISPILLPYDEMRQGSSTTFPTPKDSSPSTKSEVTAEEARSLPTTKFQMTSEDSTGAAPESVFNDRKPELLRNNPSSITKEKSSHGPGKVSPNEASFSSVSSPDIQDFDTTVPLVVSITAPDELRLPTSSTPSAFYPFGTAVIVEELERFAGIPPGQSLPQTVQNSILVEGNYSPFIDWLRSKGVHTSQNQLARLRAGHKVFGIPAKLIDAVDRWSNESLLIGAVKQINRLADTEVPKSILAQIENGSYTPFTDWLDSKRIQPPIKKLMAFARKSERFSLDPKLIEHVNRWYERFSVTAPPTTSTSTKPSTKPSLPPGVTTTPPFPLSAVEEQAAVVLQSLGCTALLSILAVNIVGYAVVVRDPSIERFLHMNQELSLLAAHILITTMRDRTDIHIPCKLASVGLQTLFLSHFTFIMFEAFQAYTIASSLIPNDGVFNRKQYAVMGWVLPLVYTGGVSTFFSGHYVSAWSCWLNLGHGIPAGASLGPAFLLSAATIVMVEAAGMDETAYPSFLNADRNQLAAAMANTKGLLFVLPASLSSWGLGLYAVFRANVALYGMVFVINLCLAINIFIFHTLGNPKVTRLILSRKTRGRLPGSDAPVARTSPKLFVWLN